MYQGQFKNIEFVAENVEERNFGRADALKKSKRKWFASPHLAGEDLLQGSKIESIWQGLVNVPFWGYWTSPHSSHYRPYT